MNEYMATRCKLRNVRLVKLKNGIIQVPNDSSYLRNVVRASKGVSGG